MNTIHEKANDMKTTIFRFVTQVRVVIREVCTFEFLGLATMLLPALMASVGFFFGQTVSPVYFYAAVAILTCAAFLVGWRRGLAYLALLAVCTMLTMYTSSYAGPFDSQTYHFPMQYLLHHGWNPVFDSTIEKFDAVAGDAQFWRYHALFLPKFCSLCDALVASAFHLFSGNGFLSYVLVACLFAIAMKFARRYWTSSVWLQVVFAGALTFSASVELILIGLIDYSVYASFCIALLALILYLRDRQLPDLALFVISTSICMASKSPGVLCCVVLVLATLPLLFRRIDYWRALFCVGILVAVVGSAPLLTNWVQYGSPFYPTMTFNPAVDVIDITSDFIENADAQSMGYFSRICYAWVSPKLTVGAIRLLRGEPSFSPVFEIGGGCEGIGMWFNVLLLASVVLLSVARKNLIAYLCLVIFVSSNFVPLKCIGYSRYVPQIWVIFPLAVMNFIFSAKECATERRMSPARRVLAGALVAVLAGLFAFFLGWTAVGYGKNVLAELNRQNLLAECAKDKLVLADKASYCFTTVQRFRQAGVELKRADEGECDPLMAEVTCGDFDPPYYDKRPCRLLKPTRTPDRIRALIARPRLNTISEIIPHVLWDDTAKGNAK